MRSLRQRMPPEAQVQNFESGLLGAVYEQKSR
jgi:hypothetical protein